MKAQVRIRNRHNPVNIERRFNKCTILASYLDLIVDLQKRQMNRAPFVLVPYISYLWQHIRGVLLRAVLMIGTREEADRKKILRAMIVAYHRQRRIKHLEL